MTMGRAAAIFIQLMWPARPWSLRRRPESSEGGEYPYHVKAQSYHSWCGRFYTTRPLVR